MQLHWSQLVHEKLAVIATFAYSQAPLAEMRDTFVGEWRFLDKILHALPEREATKALMELALYFRSLDDDQDLTELWKRRRGRPLGTLHLKDGKTEPLSPREMCNKVIHAESIDWDFSADPKVKCIGRDEERWLRAEIVVFELIAFGGGLGS